MSELAQYHVVKVLSASRPASEYDGWRLNQRPPKSGDTGAIIEILSGKQPTLFVVNHGVTQSRGQVLLFAHERMWRLQLQYFGLHYSRVSRIISKSKGKT